MPTIEIDHALADSQIEAINFVARGKWNDNAPPAAITCVLKPSSGAADVGPMTATKIDPQGLWRAEFASLPLGQTFTLHAKYAGAEPAEEPNIRVLGPDDPGLIIDPLLPPPMPPQPPAPPPDEPVFQDYLVTGLYKPRDRGVGIICLSVTRANKKIRTIEAAAAAEMKNGKWTATLRIKPVSGGKNLSIIAIMIDGEGKVVARAGQNSPKQV